MSGLGYLVAGLALLWGANVVIDLLGGDDWRPEEEPIHDEDPGIDPYDPSEED